MVLLGWKLGGGRSRQRPRSDLWRRLDRSFSLSLHFLPDPPPDAGQGGLLYDVSSGGRLVVEDIWYEGTTGTLAALNDSGYFAWDSAQLAAYTQARPLLSIFTLYFFS